MPSLCCTGNAGNGKQAAAWGYMNRFGDNIISPSDQRSGTKYTGYRNLPVNECVNGLV
ncbi:hypothetical protein EV199_0534 [Pseudobacter ginsenosidimutans]|jgi:hypothetical protein|uniref:Uncharacterized protein n=1 Tax=Pseudobacter ginsenosidimutans TaxID=661488 RepID=A0A4Q7N215_9BACT|nr:hypothetical protein EV199_0534 [Pseudobacter ginsenosidimutans]